MRNFFISATILLSVFMSCRVDENPAKRKPSADSFSPGLVKTGDTVTIIGTALDSDKIKVFVDGKEVKLINQQYYSASFLVKAEMSAKKPNLDLAVQVGETETTIFSQQLIVNYLVQNEDLVNGGWLYGLRNKFKNLDTLGGGPKQLLITDFDGHGIRTANATSRFDATQFYGLVKTGGKVLITNSYLGAIASEVGKNYFVLHLNPEFIEKEKSGYSGELKTNTIYLNDIASPWPSNFIDFPNRPLRDLVAGDKFENQYYLNFYLYKNGQTKGSVRPYLTNDNLLTSQEYAKNFPASYGNNEWKLVSIPFNEFQKGYGFNNGFKVTSNNIDSLNIIKFNFSHQSLANDNDKTPYKGPEVEGDVLIYLDHIILTQGGPFAYKKFD